MKLSFILTLAALSALPAEAAHSYATPRSYFEERVDLVEPEQTRIQRHLAAVEAELRARPTDHLSESQRQNRLARLDDLKAYRTRGEFPQNRDFPHRLIPYFIDAEGVPCAMGYLVIRSGHAAYAEEIRDTRNNAYIGEIAAVDPRLAEWVEAEGMTIEEAAMVQPSYGPPRLSTVFEVHLDGFSRPWVQGPSANDIAVFGSGYVAHYSPDSGRWVFESDMFSGFCVTKTGLPFAFHEFSAVGRWKTRNYSIGTAPKACAWSANDSDVWVGGQQGLRRLRRNGNADTLVSTVYRTPFGSSDTVAGVATTTDAVWAATNRGLYRRGTQGPDTAVFMDSATIDSRITGLKAAGKMVWIGVEGISHSLQSMGFSTYGIRIYNGSSWANHFKSMSPGILPSDTIQALAVRDSVSAWIALNSGFYRFNGLVPSTKVADLPAGVTVFDMVGNSQGFYAGTSNGVYQFRNDSLVSLGTPSVSLRPGSSRERATPTGRLRVLTPAEARTLGGRSVLGQKTGPQTAMGVYFVESPRVTPRP